MAVELPKDAKGREIPLDTRRLYDKNGERKTVLRFEYSPTLKHWTVVLSDGPNTATSASAVSHFYLTPPDSWEKLLEDLNDGANHPEHASCFYFMKAECICSTCEADRYSDCDQAAFKDIKERIRKLRGESDV